MFPPGPGRGRRRVLTELYAWIVYVHVSAAFGFVLAHGVAVFAGFRIRQERDRARIAAMLDLSTTSHRLMYVSLVILIAAGMTAGSMGGWFGRLWIWTSIGVVLVVTAAMMLIASRHYRHLRQLVGASIPPRAAGTQVPPLNPEGVDEELATRLRSRHPELLAVIGGGGLLIVIWMMMIKPF
jgi:hypothetical protein